MRILLLLLFLSCQFLSAADDGQVTTFKKAMSGNDFQAKRAAIAGLSAVKDDDVVYSLLISAVSDRQASKLAVKALRGRSGLQPSPSKGGNSGYPGYPIDDSAGAWSSWNSARVAEEKAKQQLKEAIAKAEEAKQKAEEANEGESGGEGDEKTEGEGEGGEKAEGEGNDAPPQVGGAELPPELLGELDRIFFKDGSILVGYITVRRHDMTGTLTSIHIVHKSGGGEEDIEAALISRIEDDIE